nr:PREDICTED: HAUS augmin-like complex subunit 4 isoform X1 [Lepisosteus oculatus]XP_015222504.1 PREDICTED: HAUS augmin-like complex subunit 4 isoform X1 [Lepisosteus oculatus]XP_015222505.1 PREDICTED: HAUS augmin-like complex subunit 4 isoform X1 [Lepisosteus oculatus]XP_015222506.1 PREDICTED: HAUS augmin-like complex subunit 4 isoform X1 [Lepisosteus oculatus]
MALCPDPVSSPPLAKGDGLHQQVLGSFPLCEVTEEDLFQNPHFCRLLSSLSQRIDSTGLTASLKRELEKVGSELSLQQQTVFVLRNCFSPRGGQAEREMQAQKLGWLRSESLHRLLQEMLQDYSGRKHHSQIPPEDGKFYGTLEQCLLVAQCARQLDPSPTTAQDQPQLLGLSSQLVLDLFPSEQDVKRMKQRLLGLLEETLQKKCQTILAYYQPDWEGESAGLKMAKLSQLPDLLESERKRLESERQKAKENAIQLQSLTHSYLTELLGCIQILQSLILDHRLKAQNELDRKKTQYLEAKCEIIIHKIRMEMLQVQLDSYAPQKIAVHRKIREMLESELQSEQSEKQSAEMMLSSFEILGQDFETLVKEYSRLRQEIDNKKWALQEFSQHSH